MANADVEPIKIYAEKQWQDTGVTYPTDSALNLVVNATGTWKWRPDDLYGLCDPNGDRPNSGAQTAYRYVKDDPGYPFSGPNAKRGQLIGKWGPDGAPFEIGAQRGFQGDEGEAAHNGQTLWLSINDNHFADNSGYVDVRIWAAQRNRGERIWVFSRNNRRWSQITQ